MSSLLTLARSVRCCHWNVRNDTLTRPFPIPRLTQPPNSPQHLGCSKRTAQRCMDMYKRADRDKDGEVNVLEFARTVDVETSNPFLPRCVLCFPNPDTGRLPATYGAQSRQTSYQHNKCTISTTLFTHCTKIAQHETEGTDPFSCVAPGWFPFSTCRATACCRHSRCVFPNHHTPPP